MKPLSKKRQREIEFWMVIVCLMIMISVIVCDTVLRNREKLMESKSPCELGLMEWEESGFTVECSIGNHITARIECLDDCDKWLEEFSKVFGEELCHKVPDIYNSCPYSGPGIMVVKE